jgi:hypothetical protein
LPHQLFFKAKLKLLNDKNEKQLVQNHFTNCAEGSVHHPSILRERMGAEIGWH